MRILPESLQAKLRDGVTTLCWCWRIERSDGVVLGFTDHDEDVIFSGVTYRAAGGFQPGEIRSELGFSVDSASIAGALSADLLTEADLASGKYDGAAVICLRVDWTEPADRIGIWRGEIGEIRRGEAFFEAELRGPGHRLTQTTGRVYSRRCDVELGDGRCARDVTGAAFTATGGVTQTVGLRSFRADGMSGYAAGWFTRGRLVWTSGANEGAAFDVAAHRGDVIELETAPPQPLAPGDGFTIVAGCDKKLSTCRDKFGNAANFRGFPFIPGNDVLIAGAAAETQHDGGSRGVAD